MSEINIAAIRRMTSEARDGGPIERFISPIDSLIRNAASYGEDTADVSRVFNSPAYRPMGDQIVRIRQYYESRGFVWGEIDGKNQIGKSYFVSW